MLLDEVWEAASSKVPRNAEHKHDLLCIACTEHVLGRELTVDDLLKCPGNDFTVLIAQRLKCN